MLERVLLLPQAERFFEHPAPLSGDEGRFRRAVHSQGDRQLRAVQGGSEDLPNGRLEIAGKDGAVYTTIRAAMREVADAMVEAREIDRPFSPGVIRKTVETRLAAKGVPDEVLARLLSHGLGGVQARNYNAHHYDDEKRLALRRLRSMLEPKGKASNVTQFRKRSG